MNRPNDRSVIAHSIHNKDYHTNGLKHCKDLTDRQLKHQGRKHRGLYLCLSGRTMFSCIVWPINKISHCKTYTKAAQHRKSYGTTDLNQLSFLFLFLFKARVIKSLYFIFLEVINVLFFSMSGTPRFISPVTDSCHLQDKLWATAIS